MYLRVLRGTFVAKAKGKGRGHWGHKGRKGQRGGSLPSKSGMVVDAGATSAWAAEEFEQKVLAPFEEQAKGEYLEGLKIRLRGTPEEVNPDWPSNAVGVAIYSTEEVFVFTTRLGGRRRSKGSLQKFLGHELGHHIGRRSGIVQSKRWTRFADPIIKAARAGRVPSWLESAERSMKYEKWKPGPCREEVFAAAAEWRMSFPAVAGDIPANGLVIINEAMK